MIPLPILLKMGEYELDVQGAPVKVHVADDDRVIESHFANHLTPLLLDKFPTPVVGVDVKANTNVGGSSNGILVLCVGPYCLVVQSVEEVSECLLGILQKIFEKDIVCFVGVDVDRKLKLLPSSFTASTYIHRGRTRYNYETVYLKCETGVEANELAARVMKNQSLRGQCLADVAREAGFRYEPPPRAVTGVADLGVKILSEDEVKSAVYDAYMCYKIGKKLISSLDN